MFFNAPPPISSEEICLIGLRKVAEVHVWLTSVWGIASSCIFDNFISHLASLLKAKYVKKVWNQSNRCIAIMLHAFIVNVSFIFDESEGQHNGWIVFLCVSLRFFNFLSKVLLWMMQGCECNKKWVCQQLHFNMTTYKNKAYIFIEGRLCDIFTVYTWNSLKSLKQKLVCDRCQELFKIKYPDYGWGYQIFR